MLLYCIYFSFESTHTLADAETSRLLSISLSLFFHYTRPLSPILPYFLPSFLSAIRLPVPPSFPDSSRHPIQSTSAKSSTDLYDISRSLNSKSLSIWYSWPYQHCIFHLPPQYVVVLYIDCARAQLFIAIVFHFGNERGIFRSCSWSYIIEWRPFPRLKLFIFVCCYPQKSFRRQH